MRKHQVKKNLYKQNKKKQYYLFYIMPCEVTLRIIVCLKKALRTIHTQALL